jgi:hypothetical protein
VSSLLGSWAGRSPGLVAIAVALWSGSARADSVLVVLSGPQGDAQSEVLNRVRGELVADGFRVAPAPAVPEIERPTLVRDNAKSSGSPVVVGLFVNEGANGFDVYFLDTVTERMAARHADVAPNGEPPEVVARHAVGMLRAELLDFAIEGLRSATPATTLPVERALAPPHDPPLPRLALEGGVGLLGGFAGVGISVAPVFALRFAATRDIRVCLTGAGFGSNASVHAEAGSAEVQQGVILADVTTILWRSRWIRPFAILGAGLYYAGVEGTATLPYQGKNSSAFALAVDGGLGVAAPLATNIELALDARVIVTEPEIGIRFLNQQAARLGQPSLLVTFTLVDWI